jgi:uncharacterized membrane protein
VGNDDDLVTGYLARLRAATTRLPADRQAELIEDITSHIAEARSAHGGGEAGIRNILDRLGEPAET